jgi:hypothetical protein
LTELNITETVLEVTADAIRRAAGLDQPDLVAAAIRRSLAERVPSLFQAGALCAGYPLTPAPAEYFVAHEFSREKIADLRRALKEGLAEPQLTPYFADEDLTTGFILCKMAAKIQTTAFCVFDLPKSQNRNVYLELGMALGQGRPFILIKEAAAALPSLVEGLDYFGFASYTGLRKGLAERLQIGRFATILPAEEAPPRTAYFVGDGEFEQEDFRAALERALQARGLEPVYLNAGQIGSEASLVQTIREIQAARFGIYRIDQAASANSFLALGIAIGLGRPWLLVARKNAEIPADVRGLSNFSFAAFRELETELGERCRVFLAKHAA